MKLLAVTMELSLVEAARSSSKEPLKVNGFIHSLLFLFPLYLPERANKLPVPMILSSQVQGQLTRLSQITYEPKETNFQTYQSLASNAFILQTM